MPPILPFSWGPRWGIPPGPKPPQLPQPPPPIDFEKLNAQLISQLAGPLRVSTPQLGEVENQGVQNTAAALAFLRLEAARAAGIRTTGVVTIISDRGLL
jgi:hypothetical protein